MKSFLSLRVVPNAFGTYREAFSEKVLDTFFAKETAKNTRTDKFQSLFIYCIFILHGKHNNHQMVFINRQNRRL